MHTIGAERSLVVDGETIKLDELGPIIVKEDGRLGRLSNWHEMTEPEQAATLRFVAKRNAKRRKALLEAQATNALPSGVAADVATAVADAQAYLAGLVYPVDTGAEQCAGPPPFSREECSGQTSQSSHNFEYLVIT